MCLKYIPEKDEIDLGYRFIQSAWGKGYATEAAKHTLNHGFSTLHLKTIFGKAQSDNIASIHVLQKIGMQFVNEEMEDGFAIKVFTAVNGLV